MEGDINNKVGIEAEVNFLDFCKEHVARYSNSRPESGRAITKDDVYVVWTCKTLQNNKALLGTPLPDRMYYEITYNGDKKEAYFDAYTKVANICIPCK